MGPSLNDVVSRREEGVISALIHGYMGILKDDLVHTSPMYKKMKGREAYLETTSFMDGPFTILFSKKNKYNLNSSYSHNNYF